MKKQFFFLITLSLFILSCQPDSGLAGEITKLEKSMDEAPSAEKIKDLINKYNTYVNENPEDNEWNGRYLYRAASCQLQTNNVSGAIQSLGKAVKNHGSSSATPNSLYLLAETYKNKFRQVDQANLYYQGLTEAFPGNEYAEKAKTQLKGAGGSMADRIEELKQDIYMDSTQTRVNPNKARKLVDLHLLHASLLPDSPKSPQFLYDTYEIANSVRMFREAATATEKLYKDYPEHSKAPTAMFLTGYLYENELRDLDKAKDIYSDFITKYPDNEFTKSAQFALDNLGKPADQLLEELRKKSEGQN